jgi:hypothetical protein
MDEVEPTLVASLRARVAPSHLIVTDSKRIERAVNAFQVSYVLVAGELIADAEQLLMSVPATTPIERVYSRGLEILAERLQRALAR